MWKSGTRRATPDKPGNVSVDCRLSSLHLFDLHLQIQQVQIQHQTQIVVQLQPTFKVLLRFVLLSLRLTCEPAFGIDERIAIVERNALVKIGDRELGIAID